MPAQWGDGPSGPPAQWGDGPSGEPTARWHYAGPTIGQAREPSGRIPGSGRQENALRPIYQLLSHPVFLSAFFSWLIAQLIKTTISAIWYQTRSSGELVGTIFWKTGGMPSSHSSMMTGLATAIGFTEGPATPVFMIAFFFTLVVIRDALGVRRTAGELAQRLNRLAAELSRRDGIDYQPVREVNGHTAAEVSVGVLLGFFLGVAFSIL